MDTYADWLTARNCSETTIAHRVRFANRNQHILTTATDSDLLGILDGYTGWTRTTYHSALSSYLDWQVSTGARDDNPLKHPDLVKPRPPRPMPHPLRREDESRVLAAASGIVRVLVLLGLRQGLRVHEAVKVRGEDVHEDWLYVNGKGGSFYRLPTSPEVWVAVAGLPREGWLFPAADGVGHVSAATVNRWVRELFGGLGVEGNFHRLRATYGTTLLRNGATIEVVRRLMRHSSLSSTQHYVDADGDELRAAVVGLGQ